MHFKHLSLIAVSVVTLGLATLPATAQEGTLIKRLLGDFGIIDSEQPGIEYRERAPLVVPPKTTLPPPVEATGARARVAWPNDPDVVRRRKLEEEARSPITLFTGARVHDNPTLSKRELAKGRTATRGEFGPSPIVPDSHAPLLTREQLRESGRRLDDEAVLIAGQEPRRTNLTQPPKGYRAPTQIVKPSIEPVKRIDEARPQTFITEEAQRD